VAAAVAVWAVGEPVLGYDLVVGQPGQEATDLGVGAVAFFALAASLLGWALAAGLERVTARAGLVWTVVAFLVLTASFIPLIGVEATGGSKAVLALTHVAVGAVLIPVFRRTARVADRAERPTTAACG
jgi:ABC-type branched-subunit amino acid transport system permease subunit